MNVLNKVGTALIAIFVVSLVILVAEILYVIWRRRRIDRPSAAVDVQFISRESKELLYFLCWKNQSASGRVGPAAPPLAVAAEEPPSLSDVAEGEDGGVPKWRGVLYGPSRVLFTIKEEEKEEMTEAENILENEEAKKKKKNEKKTKKEESFQSEEMDAAVAVVVEVVDDQATPFTTPCASPPYYTPPPSPPRGFNLSHEQGAVMERNEEEQTGGISEGNTAPFTGIELQS